MAASGLKRLRKYLPGGLTSELARHADQASRLQNAWNSIVSEPLGSRCHPVRYEAGVLYIHVDTPAWISRLRQQQPAIVTGFRKKAEFRELTEIRSRVVPQGQAARLNKAARTPSRLSASAAAQIARAADDVADPDLKAALQRLAHRTSGVDRPKRRS